MAEIVQINGRLSFECQRSIHPYSWCGGSVAGNVTSKMPLALSCDRCGRLYRFDVSVQPVEETTKP